MKFSHAKMTNHEHSPLLTFSVVQLLRYSGKTFPMLPFSGYICTTSSPDSLALGRGQRRIN